MTEQFSFLTDLLSANQLKNLKIWPLSNYPHPRFLHLMQSPKEQITLAEMAALHQASMAVLDEQQKTYQAKLAEATVLPQAALAALKPT